jgi:hypothetical protein
MTTIFHRIDEDDAPFAHILRQQFKVRIPFVSNDFTTRKTPYWYDLSLLISL